MWVEFYAEFVVAAADVLDKCVSSADHTGRAEPFEATHRPESALEPAMIGLDWIVPVMLHDMAHGRQQLIEYCSALSRWRPGRKRGDMPLNADRNRWRRRSSGSPSLPVLLSRRLVGVLGPVVQEPGLAVLY
jgi:hypothetical protein